MNDSVFKQNDIRGKIGVEFDLNYVYQLGQAIGYYFLNQGKNRVTKVAIAIDGRIDSPFIKQELTKSLLDSGFDVIFIGMCPTPVLYFSLHTLPIEAGIMITASHNGKEYNGLKICFEKEIVWGAELSKIKQLFKEKRNYKSPRNGTYQELNITQRYVDWLCTQFKRLKNYDKKISIDFSNSVVSLPFIQICKKLNFKNITFLHENIDGNFPAHEPDPMQEGNLVILKKYMSENQSDFAVAFDGDGDRAVAVSESLETILGDKLLCLFSKEILKHHPGRSVIYDIKCSSYLPKLIKLFNGNAVVSPTGHAIIKSEIKKRAAILGGELSCHFFFKDRYFGFDDGIYAALRLFEILKENNCSLDSALSIIPKHFTTPEMRIEISDITPASREELLSSAYKFFKQQKAELSTLDGIQAIFPYGSGLVRFSNTQPVICLRFESETEKGLEQVQKEFKQALKDYITHF